MPPRPVARGERSLARGRPEAPALTAHGMFQDVLRGPAGEVRFARAWTDNVILDDCHRLLASLLRGDAGTTGITGVQFGSGDPRWDELDAPPPPTVGMTSLHDDFPFTLPLADLKIDYLVANDTIVSPAPTARLQIVATLPAGQPPWPEPGPDPDHPENSLREFAVVAALAEQPILLNYVRHVRIVKDATSSLTRTIWLSL